MTQLQKILVALVLAITLGWFLFDLSFYFSLSSLRTNLDILQDTVNNFPITSACLFFVIYVLLAGFSLPGSMLMTLASGAMFSYPLALILVSFASSVGATCAFMISKLLLRDFVRQRLSMHLQNLKNGWERDGSYYLFSLRLVPIFPFFAINLIAGMLPISPFRFYWISQLGMLPATLIYINAGAQLGDLRDVSDVMSFKFVIALTLFAMLPFLLRLLKIFLSRLRAFAS